MNESVWARQPDKKLWTRLNQLIPADGISGQEAAVLVYRKAKRHAAEHGDIADIQALAAWDYRNFTGDDLTLFTDEELKAKAPGRMRRR